CVLEVGRRGLEHLAEGDLDALLAPRPRPSPTVIEVVFERRVCGNIAGPAFAVTDRHHKVFRAHLLGHHLVTHECLTWEEDDVRGAEVDAGHVDLLSSFKSQTTVESHRS